MTAFSYMTGKIFWAKVLGPPVPNFNRDGNEWTFDFTPDKEGVALLKELGIADKLKDKGDERGKFITFKQKEKRADGSANRPITVVNARNEPFDPNSKIGNDSLGQVKFKVVNYGKGKPVGIYPQAIRVLDLVEFVRQEFAPLPEDSEFLKKGTDTTENFPEPEVDQLDDPLDA